MQIGGSVIKSKQSSSHLCRPGFGNGPGSGLLPGVTQIIEINVLAVAINPRRDKSKPVKLRTCVLVAGCQAYAHTLTIQRHDDFSVAPVRGGVVLESPIVHCAVGVNARWVRANAGTCAVIMIAIDGVEEEAFARRPFDGQSQKILGGGKLLRSIDPQTMRRVIETEESRAVADAPAQADLARSPQG